MAGDAVEAIVRQERVERSKQQKPASFFPPLPPGQQHVQRNLAADPRLQST